MGIGVAARLLVVMVLWASCFPLITIGLDLAPHLAFAAMRAIVAGACLLAPAVVLRRPAPRGIQTWVLVAATGLGSTTLGFLGMFHGAESVSPGLATVIANTQALFTAMLARAFLGERLALRGHAGLMLGLAGIGAIAGPGVAAATSTDYASGIAFVVLAATGVAIGNVAMKRLAGRVDALMVMGFQLILGGVPLGLASLLTEDPASIVWSARFFTILLSLAVLGTALGFALWFSALERVTLNQANAFTFLVPIIGLTVGVALFDERLSWIGGAGALLTVAGIILVQRDARNLSNQQGIA